MYSAFNPSALQSVCFFPPSPLSLLPSHAPFPSASTSALAKKVPDWNVHYLIIEFHSNGWVVIRIPSAYLLGFCWLNSITRIKRHPPPPVVILVAVSSSNLLWLIGNDPCKGVEFGMWDRVGVWAFCTHTTYLWLCCYTLWNLRGKCTGIIIHNLWEFATTYSRLSCKYFFTGLFFWMLQIKCWCCHLAWKLAVVEISTSGAME